MRGSPPLGSLVAAAGVLLLSSCGHDTAAPRSRVEVVCGPDGIHLGRAVVAAGPSGVVLTVRRSTAADRYLTYASEGGPAGGDPLPRHPATRTLQAPPGELVLGCADPPQRGSPSRATLRVVDPDGNWRPTTPTALGCRPGSQPSWIAGLEGAGRTPEAAVDALLASFTRLLPAVYAARPADVGYPRAPSQVWVATKDGRPHLTVSVTRVGAAFQALPDAFCDPAPAPR